MQLKVGQSVLMKKQIKCERFGHVSEFNKYEGKIVMVSNTHFEGGFEIANEGMTWDIDDIERVIGEEFEVGDYVIGKPSANTYNITKEGWIGRVVFIDKPIMDVKDIVNPDDERIYNVCCDHFEYYYGEVDDVKKEGGKLMYTYLEKKEQVDTVIQEYNRLAGTVYKFSTPSNQDAVLKCLELADYPVIMGAIPQYKEEVKENTSLQDFCRWFIVGKGNKQITSTAGVVESKGEITLQLGIMEKLVIDIISSLKMDTIHQAVSDKLESDVRDFIKREYGIIERKTKIEVEGRETMEVNGTVHKQFETVVNCIKENVPVFLCGPAGCGKNHLCKQVADALGLDFYFSNAVTQEYKITGYVDAYSNYQESQFYKAFTQGGLFLLDEIDASIPEVLLILNAAIGNGYFDFPAPIGYREVHPNFRVIAAGNTYGYGANYEYVGRNQLDAASLDRFLPITMDYDEGIENALANGDEKLLAFCRAFRKAVGKAGIKLVVSYRAIDRMAKLQGVIDVVDLVEMCLIRGMGIDDMEILKDDLRNHGLYSSAFDEVYARKKVQECQ